MSVTEETRRESYYKTDRNTRQIEVLGGVSEIRQDDRQRMRQTSRIYRREPGEAPDHRIKEQRVAVRHRGKEI